MAGECLIVKAVISQQKVCLTCGKRNEAVDACKAKAKS
jgi:hypothetical protein